jgi:hypothetical protein
MRQGYLCQIVTRRTVFLIITDIPELGNTYTTDVCMFDTGHGRLGARGLTSRHPGDKSTYLTTRHKNKIDTEFEVTGY